MFKDSLFYIIGGIITKIIPFIFIPYLTRKMGLENYADLSLALSVISLIYIFINLSQDLSLTRYAYYYGKRGYILTLISGVVINFLLSAFLCLMLIIFHYEQYLILIIITSLQSLFSLFLAKLQLEKKAQKYMLVIVLQSLISVLVTVVFFELDSGSFGNRLYAIAISYIFILVPLFTILKKTKVRTLKRHLKYIFGFGLPLIVHNLSYYGKGQFDRLYLSTLMPKEELAVYSVAVQLTFVIVIILNLANKAIIPYFYEYIKSGKITSAKLRRFAPIPFVFSALIYCMVLIIPDFLIVKFVGDDFARVTAYLPVFSLGFSLISCYMIFANYFFYYGETKKITYSNLISMVVYLCFLFVFSSIDFIYIPWAVVASNITLFICVYSQLKRLP